jgi:hypothetical protein
MRLDLRDTFIFTPKGRRGSPEYERTVQTIDLFGLNEADLAQQRMNAFGSYVARLKEYIAVKRDAAKPQKLGRLRNALLRLDHRTVWVEMQQQADKTPQLRGLFADAPEAREW